MLDLLSRFKFNLHINQLMVIDHTSLMQSNMSLPKTNFLKQMIFLHFKIIVRLKIISFFSSSLLLLILKIDCKEPLRSIFVFVIINQMYSPP